MTAYFRRIALSMICGLALVLLGISGCRVTAPAPPAPLVAAVQSFITDSLRPQSTAAGVQFSVVPDSNGGWARALVTTVTPTNSRQPTLELRLARIALDGDSATVHAQLVGCTPAVRGMNFFVHTIRLRFRRVDSGWQYLGRTIDMIADGECTP